MLYVKFDKCSIFNCYSSRADPRISFFRIPTKNDDKIKLEEKHCCSYYSCVHSDLKRQIKNQTLHTSRLFLLTKTFQYTSKTFDINYYNLTAFWVQIKIIQPDVINKKFNCTIINHQ